MNPAVNALYADYLGHTGGDKAAAASLTLAAVLMDRRPVASTAEPSPAEPALALTVAQAAKRLGVVPKTIYEMCQSRRLRSFRPGAGRVLRIPVEEIKRLENESGATRAAPLLPAGCKRYC